MRCDVTYLIYILTWEAATIGGCAYVVFWLGHSGWWFLLAVLLSGMAYKPAHWRALTTKGDTDA